MKSNAPVKQFDCVAYMREARERISAKMSGVSREEFRRWVNSSLTEDPILARLIAASSRAGRTRDRRKPTMKSPVTRGTGASRTRSGGIVAEITRDEVDGSGSARSLGPSILTGDGPHGDMHRNVRDAVNRHFDETMQRPSVICLHFVTDEIVLA